jgi:hypothetical protein
MGTTLETIAYEAALRSLDKQERVLEEVRSRAAVFLGLSSLTTTFLGRAAFDQATPGKLLVVGLLAFALSMAATVYVLLPKRTLVFSVNAVVLYETFAWPPKGSDIVYRSLLYELDRLRRLNDMALSRMFAAFRVASFLLVVEVAALLAAVRSIVL